MRAHNNPVSLCGTVVPVTDALQTKNNSNICVYQQIWIANSDTLLQIFSLCNAKTSNRATQYTIL